MLTEYSDLICDRLRTVAAFEKVGEWAGEVDDLVKTVQPLPSAHVIFSGAQFENAPAAMGTKIAPHRMVWTVVLFSQNLRDRQTHVLSAYALIEAVRAALIKFPLGNDWLWPVREGLILAERGKLVYGLDYAAEAETEG